MHRTDQSTGLTTPAFVTALAGITHVAAIMALFLAGNRERFCGQR